MSSEVVSNDGSPGILNVPPERTSWLKSSLAKLGSASRVVLLGATALVSVCASNPASAQQPATPAKPNILFIMGDDIGWMQPSIYHRGLAVGETPNIDRIPHSGASLTPLVLFAASPGTITGVITLSAAHTGLDLPVTALVAIAVAGLVTWLVLLLVSRVAAKASEGGSARDMVTRFMGLIVLSMGVQFALTGLHKF